MYAISSKMEIYLFLNYIQNILLLASFLIICSFWSLDPAAFHCDYSQSIFNDILLQLNQIVFCHLL